MSSKILEHCRISNSTLPDYQRRCVYEGIFIALTILIICCFQSSILTFQHIIAVKNIKILENTNKTTERKSLELRMSHKTPTSFLGGLFLSICNQPGLYLW